MMMAIAMQIAQQRASEPGEPMRTVALEEHFMARGYEIEPGKNATFDFPLAQLKDLGPRRLRDMDAGGIDVQVLSQTVIGDGEPQDPQGSIRYAREANDQLASAVSVHPDRFAAFATLPMAAPKQAAGELQRAIKDLGFCGAIINGTTQGRFLDDPVFLPVLEQAVELRVPIYLHPGLPPEPVRQAYYSGLDPRVNFTLAAAGWGFHAETGLHVLRLIMAGVFDRLPGLQLIIGHMGEMLPFMMARCDDWLTPLGRHLQHSVAEYMQRHIHITTSGVFSLPPLLLAMQTFGVDRILFSVDYPYSDIARGRLFLDSAPLSTADRAKISHQNADRLLGLGSHECSTDTES